MQLPLVTDRVLVLVDGGPASKRAIRTAAELAGALHAALVAVVVETPEADRQPFDRNRDLQEVIADAIDLGAEVVRVEAADVATGLANVARDRRASHVVLPYRAREGPQAHHRTSAQRARHGAAADGEAAPRGRGSQALGFKAAVAFGALPSR